MGGSCGWEPKLVFCLERSNCRLADKLSEALSVWRSSNSGDNSFMLPGGYPSIPPLALRLLRVNMTDDDMIEEWLRMSGDPKALEGFLAMLRRMRSTDARISVAYRHRFSAVLRVIHKPWDQCFSCPMLRSIRGAMPKTVMILPGARLLELIVVEREALDKLVEKGCKMLRVSNVSEMDYMLTPKQEFALMLAYARGFYEFPKKTRLRDLAEELDLSVSTLAELLHRAEKKVIEAFIRHELPHYLAFKILGRVRRMRGRRPRGEAKLALAPTVMGRGHGSRSEDQ